MKTLMIKTSILIAFLAICITGQAQVFVDGIVYHYTEDEKPIQVTVMEDEQFYKSIETSKSGKFRLRLQPNHYYVLNFSKPDHYVTKIAVDTHIPFDPGPEFYTEIPLEADLVRKYIDMDPAVMKKPLSIFSYDAASETFIQDDEYLQQARTQLEAFLYEVDQAKKRDQEELATTTPEKNPEDSDSLNPDFEKENELASNSNNTSNANELLKEENNEDTETAVDIKKVQSKESSKNNNKATKGNQNILASNNVSGPSAPQVEVQKQNTEIQNDTTEADTTQMDTGISDVPKSYNISIEINGKTYDPNSTAPIEVNNDLDIDINGLQKEDYQDFEYQLSGKDDGFKTLNDDDLEYDKIEMGSYTFILKAKDNASFEEMRVPLKVTEEESDFPWIFILIGLIVLVLIIMFSKRKKRTDIEEDRTTVERRDLNSNRDISDEGEINNRNDPDDRV